MGLGIAVGFAALHEGLSHRPFPRQHRPRSTYRIHHVASQYVRTQEQQHSREDTDSCRTWQNILLVVGILATIAGIALIILSIAQQPPSLAMSISGSILFLGGGLSTFFGAVRT